MVFNEAQKMRATIQNDRLRPNQDENCFDISLLTIF